MKIVSAGSIVVFVSIGFALVVGVPRVDAQHLTMPILPDRPAQFEILNDPESSLRITYAYPDVYESGRKVVKYSVTNTGTKNIRSASLVVHYGEGKIHGQTGFFTSMAPGDSHRGVVLLDELMALDLRGAQVGVDYVYHTDGSSWGKNAAGEADVNVGHEAGQREAVQAVREAIGDAKKLKNLLERGAVERVIKSRTAAEKPKWSEGYRFGYGLTTGTLRIALQYRKMGGLLEKLAEIERSFKTN